MNKTTFFTGESSRDSLAVFIAWLNLDLGIETCFYNGMNTYVKTWLQFAFPLFIWLITLAMIISSHYFTSAAKLVGRSAPKVLATLFLLSYTKLIRTEIAALSFTFLEYPNGHQQAVWLNDGNIQYLTGKHIPLFIAAMLFLLIFTIPYTALVLFAPCIQKSNNRFFKCVMRKGKPILDAYMGPFKDKYRFWSGLLLLARTFLLVAFAGNASGNPFLNLLLVLATVFFLLAAQLCSFHGIYRQWALDILEAFFLVNVGMLSSATLYLKLAGGNQTIATDISTIAAAIAFIGILCYHISIHPITKKLKACVSVAYRNRRRGTHELVNLIADSEDTTSDLETITDQPQACVQPLQLIFDEQNKPVLVAEDNMIVQSHSADRDKEYTSISKND